MKLNALNDRTSAVGSVSESIASLTEWLSKNHTIQIIQGYAPTLSHADEELEEIHNEIAQILEGDNSYFKNLIGNSNAKSQYQEHYMETLGMKTKTGERKD